ncbi:MAG: hypothetical protein ACRDGH_16395, partial [Candidatus Limnocylindria bacterium]
RSPVGLRRSIVSQPGGSPRAALTDGTGSAGDGLAPGADGAGAQAVTRPITTISHAHRIAVR